MLLPNGITLLQTDLLLQKKPLDYWLDLKKSTNIIIHEHDYEEEFGIYIEITKPRNEQVNIVSIQKLLLDGVISAFHKLSNVDPMITEYLASCTENLSEYIFAM